jgi:Cyclic nucleotide-binding domain/Pyridoxamine 5'-phosphate oxidase
MAAYEAVEIPEQVLDYLTVHHIITIGTASFTGMPHAATVAYASDAAGVYFSMRSDELTLRNIDANHWSSFTIDDYTPDFRKVRELRGVGRCAPVVDEDQQETVRKLFGVKLPSVPSEALQNLHRISPLELHFVDFEYTAGVAVPMESSIVYQALPEATEAPANHRARLDTLHFEPGEIIVRQGETSDRFFIIVEGEVEVRREGHGQDVVVTRQTAGQIFGEVGALTGRPQPATITSLSRTAILAIDRSAFQAVVTHSAEADLGHRIQETLLELGRNPLGS